MTSLAFGCGVLPLVSASGAGAGAQRAIGTAVIGGVVTSTFLVTIFAPLFYVLIQKTFGKKSGRQAARIAGVNSSGEKDHE
jgi:HAE1 family hydrophobic/amphiphilic exporter-1